jgi:hypothetical protein
MRLRLSLLLLVSLLCFWCTAAAITCSDDDDHLPGGFAPYPETVLNMPGGVLSPFEGSGVSDELVDDLDIAGYRFSVDDDCRLIISCSTTDAQLEPVMDLYEARGSSVSYITTDHGSGFFWKSDNDGPDSLIMFNLEGVTTTATFDIGIAAYKAGTAGDFYLQVAALPTDAVEFGDIAEYALVTDDEYCTTTLASHNDGHYYFFSVDDTTDCIIYCDSDDFEPYMELNALDGDLLETAVLSTTTPAVYGVEIDFSTSSFLASGTYILYVSSDDTNSGEYDVGFLFNP